MSVRAVDFRLVQVGKRREGLSAIGSGGPGRGGTGGPGGTVGPGGSAGPGAGLGGSGWGGGGTGWGPGCVAVIVMTFSLSWIPGRDFNKRRTSSRK